MRVIEKISAPGKPQKGSVLTIGNFDGVHLGHQKILAAAKEAAAKKNAELVAMTFEPDPFVVLHPGKAPCVLTPLPLKSRLLADLGVDCLVVLRSFPEFLQLSAEDFVQRFLVNGIQPGAVLEGEDFNFGYNRGGNINKLRQLAPEKGFTVSVVQARKITLSTGENVRVSSTLIRSLLQDGRAPDAATALGRYYRLIGHVVPGHGKGKRLGFPTANLEPTGQVIPAEGVYAGLVEIEDTDEKIYTAQRRLPAVFSIGTTPTYGSNRPQLIEAHLLSANVADLVGKCMAMDFVEKIRDQMKFDTEDQLIGQIAKDCRKSKEILSSNISD